MKPSMRKKPMNRATKCVVAALSALLVSGCGTTIHWMRSDTTAQQYASDDYDCTREARRPYVSIYGSRSAPVASAGERFNTDLYIACMKARGYTQK